MPPPATSGGPDALSVARPGQPPALLQGWSKMSSSQPVSFVTIPGSHSYWEEDRGRVTLLAKMAQASLKAVLVGGACMHDCLVGFSAFSHESGPTARS